MNPPDMQDVPNQQGRDESHPVPRPGDPDARRMPDSDDERVIASYDTQHKTAIPLQVDAPRNEFAGAFPKPHADFFAQRGSDYEAYRKAFEFGARLAADERFAGQSWILSESGVRQEWEREHGNEAGVWNALCPAIRAGWEDQRGSG
jgi:hypothetical protein